MKLLTEASLPAVLHSDMQALMKSTNPCSNAIDRTVSRLSVYDTDNLTFTVHTLAKTNSHILKTSSDDL